MGLGNAYAGFEEDRVGVLALACFADVTMPDSELIAVAPMRFFKTKALRTLAGGAER